MTYEDLTREQAEKLGQTVRAQVSFYLRLQTRVEMRGLPPGNFDDDVKAALNTLERLAIRLHYASCAGGVGHPAKP